MPNATPSPWSATDCQHAQAHGWELREVWDMDEKKLFLDVHSLDGHTVVSSNALARKLVSIRAGAGDQVAAKAERLVFESRIADRPRQRKR